MKRSGLWCCLAVLYVLAAWGTVFAGSAPLVAVHWDDASQRWRDIATNPYDGPKKANYAYEQASVLFTYDDSGSTFKGTVTGSGLKPNFAYQIKLNGKPTSPWEPNGDDVANEQLGYNGRWWVDKYDESGYWVAGWNSDDTEYNKWKELGFTDGSHTYVFQGYVLFDYMVTDASGKVSQPFALDSSLHVLWKTSQRTRTANDTMPRTYTVTAQPGTGWYSRNYKTREVSIYGEWEAGRALPGKCVLPAGNYRVRLLLTEESFHENSPGSGWWATVMCHDDIAFQVAAPAPPTGVTVTSVAANDTRVGGQYDVKGTVVNDSPTTAITVDLDCKVSGNKSQVLGRKSVSIEAGGSATVLWNDAVDPAIKPGTYTATVTVVQTGATKVSNPFTVTRK